MKILFVGGVFAEENEEEIINCAKRPVEFSANIFQKKLISGLKSLNEDTAVISAPFIGSYPNASNIMFFKGFEKQQQDFEYVKFNNIWGLRNFSRANALKKSVEFFVNEKDDKKLVVVYSPHTPFLQAAAYIKKKDPNVKIHIVIPDLPEFMNLDAKISAVYKILKKADIRKFLKLNEYVDSYTLLTEQMKEKLPINGKPYCVCEGIVSEDRLTSVNNIEKSETEKKIVYTGKLNEKFGVRNLVDEFMKLENSTYRLVLCGKGDSEGYINEKAKEDSRICFLGQLTPEEAEQIVSEASVLVNPRPDNEEYTKYSFPSKNFEYLISGNPVVAYRLAGMSPIYEEFIYSVKGDLSAAIEQALNDTEENKSAKYQKAVKHLKTLTEKKTAEKIINVSFND